MTQLQRRLLQHNSWASGFQIGVRRTKAGVLPGEHAALLDERLPDWRKAFEQGYEVRAPTSL